MNELNGHPERIIPDGTGGGALASHLKRYQFAEKYCSGRTVLDAACGVGYGSFHLGDVASSVVGADFSDEALEYGRRRYVRPNVRFCRADVHALPFVPGSFEVACSFETLEHVEQPAHLVREVSRVLTAAGLFLVSTPAVQATNFQPVNPHHRVEYDRADFEEILRRFFGEVQILGQRRHQSRAHAWLQRADGFGVRTKMPRALRRAVVAGSATVAWEDVSVDDIVIDGAALNGASEFVAVCRFPTK